MEGSTSEPLTNGSGSRRPQKLMDPTDPDPEYWLELIIIPPYLIVDSEVQLSTSTPTTTNGVECFPSYSKMEQPLGK
jgi:hypothetical protein